MSSEVGSGTVAIFPVFKGFRGTVEKESSTAAKAGGTTFSKAFKGLGGKVGTDLGKSLKSGISTGATGAGSALAKRLQSEVASASRALATSRLKEQDAAGKLRIAEAALNEARAKNVAGSSRLVAAEEKAAAAARGLASTQESVKDASNRLSTAQTRVRESTSQAGAAAARSGIGFRSAGTALTGLRAAAGGVSRLFGAGLGLGVGIAAVNALGSGVRRLTSYISSSISTAAVWSTLNAQTGAVIKSTGGAANVTAKGINALSQSLENQTATEAEAIQNGANLLLTFTGIRNEAGKGNKIFDRTTATAVDMAKALGISVPAAALQLGKALNDPAKGLTKLQRSGVSFTEQQRDQVKAMVAAGDTLGAQKLIIAEVNKEFGGSGAAYAKTYAGALYRIKDAAGDFGASIASAALPAISKLLGTGADLINWAGGTNVVQRATVKLASGVGTLADKALALAKGLKGKNPLEGLFKVALPNVDFGKFKSGIQTAIGAAKPLIGAFLSYVRNIGPGVAGVLAAVGPALAGVFQAIGPAVQQALPSLSEAFVELLPSAVVLLKAIIPLVPPLASTIAGLAPVVGVLAGGLSFLVTNALVPFAQLLSDASAPLGRFAQGASIAQVQLEGLQGKFGPINQKIQEFRAFAQGNLNAVIGFFGGLASNVRSFMTGVAVSIGIGIARGIQSFQRIGQIPGIAARAIGGFVSSVAAGLGRAVSAVGSGIGRIVSTIGQLPGRAVGVLGGLGSRLFSSGAALIQGFINGIASKIGEIAGVAGRAVAAAADFFPHSPAKRGPLSGKGYTLYSGRTAGLDFARGLSQSVPQIARSSSAATRAAMMTAQATRATAVGSVGRGSSSNAPATVTIVNKTNVRLEDLIDVHVENGFVQYNRTLNTKQRQGRLKPQFAR